MAALSPDMTNLTIAPMLRRDSDGLAFAGFWAASRTPKAPAIVCNDSTGEVVRSAQTAHGRGIPLIVVTDGPFPPLWPLSQPKPVSAAVAEIAPAELPHMQAPIATAIANLAAVDAGKDDAGKTLALLQRLRLTPFLPEPASVPEPASAFLNADRLGYAVVVILDGPKAAERMFRASRAHPGATLVAVGVDEHGTLGAPITLPLPQGAAAVQRPVEPWSLLQGTRAVYVGEHPAGLTALLAGTPVATDGSPFYSGFGLTEDLASPPWAGHPVPLADFAHLLFTRICRYRSPYDGTELAFEEAARLQGFLLDRRRENDRPAVCVGVKWWNHRGIGALLDSPAGSARFIDDFDKALDAAVKTHARLCFWAAQMTQERATAAERAGVAYVRLEDGFLRSVGLGAALAKGASAAFDRRGIYFDATRPSDLEWMLENIDLTAEEIARAAALREKIVASRLTKYNVGRASTDRIFAAGKTGILVPGQVADDAGILKTLSTTIDCSGTENVNLQLLRAARERNPDACIVFKPHPDVEADLRKGRIAPDVAARYADAVVTDIDIVDLLDQCDRVETISSLSGFEALMRGKMVTVHGMPFYAGWGLTDDLATSPRRTRRRNLDELVHFALIAYARYIDPVTLLPCPPEVLVDRLTTMRGDRRHAITYSLAKFLSWFGRKIGL